MRPTLLIKLGQGHTRYAVPSSLTRGGLTMPELKQELVPALPNAHRSSRLERTRERRWAVDLDPQSFGWQAEFSWEIRDSPAGGNRDRGSLCPDCARLRRFRCRASRYGGQGAASSRQARHGLTCGFRLQAEERQAAGR